MRFSSGAKKALCIGAAALAVVLAFRPPLVERVYAEKDKSAQVNFSKKEKKQLLKNFEKAVKAGNLEKAKELMEHPGAVIGEKEKTAGLFIASKRGNLEMVKLLVKAGADVNAFDMNSYKTRESGWTSLVYAAVNDHLDVVKYFIEELEIDVDQPDIAGSTALMNTSYFKKSDFEKNYEMIEYLLSQGADANAVSNNGTTAIMGTAIDERIDIAAMLVQNGAKPGMRTTDYGDTALYRAVERDNFGFVEFLLGVGVDINVQDDFGVTPLIKAALNGSVNSVKILVAKGADVNLKDDEGRSALMYAVRGADPRIEDLSGEELESMGEAQRNHYELKKQYRKESIEIINVLLSSPNLDVNAKDKSGKKALDYTDDAEIKEILKKHIKKKYKKVPTDGKG